jgi:serine/threonine-protein kinase
MVAADGQVKILDFGLAKALQADLAETSHPDFTNSPTLAATATMDGALLGTSAYMSPEQARGAPVDKRTDIWAFGVVLWEMITGQRLFAGETVSETLAAVLRDPVPPVEAMVDIHPLLRQLLERCLERDPRRRLRDIGEARITLENLEADTGEGVALGVESQAARGSGWRERTAWAVATLAIAAAAAFWWTADSDKSLPERTHFAVTMATGQTLSLLDQPGLALSPDGRKLAFTATDPESGWSMIYLRMLDQLEARPIPETKGATHPFFSPDGESLAFFADHRLKTVPLDGGGGAFTLAEAPNPRGAVWGSDGFILFAPSYDVPLARVPAGGGSTEDVLTPDSEQGERTYRWPDLLPGGRVAIFTVGAIGSPNAYGDALIVAHDFETGERQVLLNGGSMARYLAPDKLVYSRLGQLFVVGFNAESLEVLGDPKPVIDGIAGDSSSGAGFFAVASNGTLAYMPGTSALFESYLTLVDRQGDARRLPLSRRGFREPRFSPDGSQLAFGVGDGFAAGNGDIWVYSLASGALKRVTFDGDDETPVWTPDGSRIAFSRERDRKAPGVAADSPANGIYVAAADGTGSAKRLLAFRDEPLLPVDWSPDGGTLAYTSISVPDIFLLNAGEETGTLFEPDAAVGVFSPNGRWIAYTSPASGTTDVFVRPVEGEGKWQVSPSRGAYPRWSADGRELFYIDTGSPERPRMVVDIEDGTSFGFGAARVVVPDLTRFTTATAPHVNWDAAPDGQTFAFVELERGGVERSRVEVILNWADHLEIDSP